MTHRVSSSREHSAWRDGKSVDVHQVFMFMTMGMIVVDVASVVLAVVVWTKTPLERKTDELRLPLEPEGGVDDQLSDIVKTPVNR